MTIIIGIDPGYEDLGIGLIETDPIPTFIYCDTLIISKWYYKPGFEHYADIKRMSKVKREVGKHYVDIGERLMSIETYLQDVLSIYKPDCAAVEEPFFPPSRRQVAKQVDYIVGVIFKNLKAWGIPFSKYSAKTVKLELAGSGNAEKDDVLIGVDNLLKVPNKYEQKDDSIDALAIALTHYEKTKLEVKYG